jgi:hypothetical protein
MKIRNGFVSNSSSSSFLVAFPEEPKCVEDVIEMVFKDIKEIENDGYMPSPEYFSSEQLAETIFDDIKRNGALTKERIYEMDEYNFWNGYSRQDAKDFVAENPDKFIYSFEYGDDTQYFATLERGNIFRNLVHEVFNNH